MSAQFSVLSWRITSDVDGAVYIDPALAPPSPYGYAAELSAALGQAAGRRDVDVVILNHAPPCRIDAALRARLDTGAFGR